MALDRIEFGLVLRLFAPNQQVVRQGLGTWRPFIGRHVNDVPWLQGGVAFRWVLTGKPGLHVHDNPS